MSLLHFAYLGTWTPLRLPFTLGYFYTSLVIVLTFLEPVWYVLDGLEFKSQSEERFFLQIVQSNPDVRGSFHLKPILRLSGALPLLPLCALVVCVGQIYLISGVTL